MRDISYTPVILRSMREICERMGVGKAVVRRWVTEGAPIAVEGRGRRLRYSAELLMLQTWRISPEASAASHEEAMREQPAPDGE